jgi:hypothetical protein
MLDRLRRMQPFVAHIDFGSWNAFGCGAGAAVYRRGISRKPARRARGLHLWRARRRRDHAARLYDALHDLKTKDVLTAPTDTG